VHEGKPDWMSGSTGRGGEHNN